MAEKAAGGIGRRRFLGAAAAVGGATTLAGAGTAVAVPAQAGAPAATAGSATADTAFRAVAVTSQDQQYRDLVRGMNQRYVGTPEKVHLVGSIDQIPAIVESAVAGNKRITVRSGGHCLEDFVFNPDVQVVLDVSLLNQVYYDSSRRAFAVETGAQLLDIYEKLYPVWGVTLPGGICYSVGAGGHVSGGGWGLLCRQLGLIIDYLYAVEVVVVGADGKARTLVATSDADDPNRDLWWAHAGGGGGNFGVITRYWFRTPGATGTDPKALLPKPPAEVFLSAVSWKWSDMDAASFKTLVTNYARFFVANSGPTSPYNALASFLVVPHRSNGQIAMVTQVDATVPHARGLHDRYLAAINNGLGAAPGALTRDVGEFRAMAQFAEPRRLPWLEATRYLGPTNADLTDPTLRQDYKSAYMRANFPDRQVDVLYKHLTRTDFANPRASVTLSSYGGKVNTVAPAATAYPHRESMFKMMWMSLWSDAADDAANETWNQQFYEELYADTGGVPVPNTVTDGCYVNYPDRDLSDSARNKSTTPWHGLYYKGNYARLQQIKKVYDPKNVFRHRQSIQLPS